MCKPNTAVRRIFLNRVLRDRFRSFVYATNSVETRDRLPLRTYTYTYLPTYRYVVARSIRFVAGNPPVPSSANEASNLLPALQSLQYNHGTFHLQWHSDGCRTGSAFQARSSAVHALLSIIVILGFFLLIREKESSKNRRSSSSVECQFMVWDFEGTEKWRAFSRKFYS
jgi:hypothetical protein